MADYTSRLSLPLLGLSPEAVSSVALAALAADPRSLDVYPDPEPCGRQSEHVAVAVRFAASSSQTAREIASELHDAALQEVLASMPPDDPDRGWTSGFDHPDLVSG